MPMFINRLIVLGASLVCSVESTRWPVSAALTAISAVSKSRISPTRMMFGSWRRNERSAAAKFRPMFSRTCTWLMPARLNSTGSSAVMMLVSGVLIFAIDEYSVFVLPLPVGPVTSTMPHGRRIAGSNLASDSGSKPSFVMSSISLSLSSRRMTIFSPKSVGSTETRKSISFGDAVLVEADLDAAVLRQPLLGDVELRHDLDARRDRVAELHRRAHDVVENPVDAVADAQLLLVRLDVDVARALLDRRHQHDVDQPDDRRFLALLGQRLGADLLQLLEDLDVAGVVERRLQLLEALARHLERARAARHDRRGAGRPCRSTRRLRSGSTSEIASMTAVSDATTGSTL